MEYIKFLGELPKFIVMIVFVIISSICLSVWIGFVIILLILKWALGYPIPVKGGYYQWFSFHSK